jgi:hypothetical protein
MASKDASAVTAALKRGDDVRVESQAQVEPSSAGGTSSETQSTSSDTKSTSAGSTDINGLVPADAAVKAEQAANVASPPGLAPGEVHGGADPCDSWGYGSSTACDNVAGSEWTTDHFWYSNTQKIKCPSDNFGPVTYLNFLGAPFVEWGISTTTSKLTSVAVGVQDSGSITITNDNTDGHHHSFTPVLLCCQPANGPVGTCDSGNGPGSAGPGASTLPSDKATGNPTPKPTETSTSP